MKRSIRHSPLKLDVQRLTTLKVAELPTIELHDVRGGGCGSHPKTGAGCLLR